MKRMKYNLLKGFSEWFTDRVNADLEMSVNDIGYNFWIMVELCFDNLTLKGAI